MNNGEIRLKIHEHIRQAAILIKNLEPSREVSVARTKLDEARQWLQDDFAQKNGPSWP